MIEQRQQDQIGDVAHAFANALTAIRGYSELLLGHLDPLSPLRREAEAIQRTAERAASLPRRLLALGSEPVRDAAIDLDAAVDAELELLREILGTGIDVATSFDAEGALVGVSRAELEQLVLALALSARDLLPDAGGALTVATRLVDEPSPLAVVSISGVGMLDGADRAALGLSGAVELARSRGGFLSLGSGPDGFAFELRLPRAQVAEDAVATACSQKTILLAEDEEAVRSMLVQVLEGEGFRVIAAENGIEALAAAADHAAPIDVLVTDVVMPELGGVELASELAARSPGTRVIFISGYTEDAALAEGAALGTVELLRKPFSIHDLVARVRSQVAETREEAAAPTQVDVDVRPALTKRELEVLALVAKGLTNEGIGSALGISAETVQVHVRNAMAKLDASTRTEAVARALRASLIG